VGGGGKGTILVIDKKTTDSNWEQKSIRFKRYYGISKKRKKKKKKKKKKKEKKKTKKKKKKKHKKRFLRVVFKKRRVAWGESPQGGLVYGQG